MLDFKRTLFDDTLHDGGFRIVRKVEVTFAQMGRALYRPNVAVMGYIYGPRGGFSMGTPNFSIDEFRHIAKELEKAEDEYDQYVRENS